MIEKHLNGDKGLYLRRIYVLKGNLVELRAITKENMNSLYKWRNDDEVSYWATGNSPFFTNVSMEQLDHFFEQVSNLNKKDECVFAVYTLEGKCIGIADYRDVDAVTHKAVIGLTIGDKEYWGKGFGTDAVQTLVKYLFLNLNMRKIQLDTWSGNKRAIRSYEKCGFQVEGVLREDVYVNGEYYDTVIMGLLREEWDRDVLK